MPTFQEALLFNLLGQDPSKIPIEQVEALGVDPTQANTMDFLSMLLPGAGGAIGAGAFAKAFGKLSETLAPTLLSKTLKTGVPLSELTQTAQKVKPFVEGGVWSSYVAFENAMKSLMGKDEATGGIPTALAELLTGEQVSEEIKKLTGPFEEMFFWPSAGPMAKGVLQGLKLGLEKGVVEPTGKVLETALWPLKKVVQAPLLKPITGPEGRHSIQEVFQPAIDRLQGEAKDILGRFYTEKSRWRKGLQEIGEELEKLSPSQRVQLLNTLSNPEVLTGQVGNIDPTTKYVIGKFIKLYHEGAPESGTFKLLRDLHYQDSLFKFLGKYADELSVALPSLNKYLEGSNPQKGWQKILRGIAENPSIDQGIRTTAQTLYNLPAITVKEVFDNVMKSETNFLVSQILSNPLLHSTTPRPGYIKSQLRQLQDLYLPRDLEFGLRDAFYTIRSANKILNELVVVPWKLAKVAWNPAVHIRNIWGNIVLNDIGGLPFYRMDIYMRALKDMMKGAKEWKQFSKLYGEDITWAGSELYEVIGPRKIRALHGDTPNMTARILDFIDKARDTKTFEKLVYVPGKLQRLYQAEELWAKYAKYLWNKRQGMSPKEAIEDAIKWTFNYAQVTPAVQSLRTSVIPFFTWQSKVVPLWFEALQKNPVRVLKWALLPLALQQSAISSLNLTEGEWTQLKEKLPTYYSQGWVIPLPFRDEKGRINIINASYLIPGLGDVIELAKGIKNVGRGDIADAVRNWWSHPLMEMAQVLRSGMTSEGIPIYNEWDNPSTKYLKLMWWFWKNMTPGWLGLDLEHTYKIAKGSEKAIDPEILAMRLFGVPAKTIGTEQEITTKAYNRAQMEKSKIMSELKQYLKEYPNLSPEERDEVAKEYADKLLDMYRRQGFLQDKSDFLLDLFSLEKEE